jgi:serine/threonine-protein kinase
VLPVKLGEIIENRYKIERMLGGGGMGAVFLATQLHLGERVAIKFLSDDATRDKERLTRFLREARAAARIKSEHVVRVLDVAVLENGAPYIAMEYLEGKDLERVVESRGPLPLDEAVDYVLQACEALAEAHVAGIVHRDLKPANLFATQRADGSPVIKVLDFGISKVHVGGENDESTLTSVAELLGSPLYMSPEQMLDSRKTTPQADVWALGVILFQLLTGTVPFPGTTIPQICGLILSAPAPKVASKRPDLGPEIDVVIGRCLQRNLDQRYKDVAELARALAPLAPARSEVSIERILRTIEPGTGRVASAPSRASLASGAELLRSVPPPDKASPLGPGARTNMSFTRSALSLRRTRPAAVAIFVSGGVIAGGLGALALVHHREAQISPATVAFSSPMPSPRVPSPLPTAVPDVPTAAPPTPATVSPVVSAAPAPPATSVSVSSTPSADPVDLELEVTPTGGATTSSRTRSSVPRTGTPAPAPPSKAGPRRRFGGRD